MALYFTKTSIGHSHLMTNKCCQDFSLSYHDEERTIVAACDGHGSNVYIRSHLGAKFACEAALKVLRSVERSAFYPQKRKGVIENLRLNVLCEWNALVETHLCKKPITRAEMAGLTESEIRALRKNPVKAYGTTLNAAMLMGNKMVCIALGDGGCFLIKGGNVLPPFPEDEDEPVANVTYSLCQDDAFAHLQVSIHDTNGYDGAIVCTDGMLNPYQNLSNFSEGLVAPAVVALHCGKHRRLEEFVSDMGLRLGTGDDVSLGLVLKSTLPLRKYAKASEI